MFYPEQGQDWTGSTTLSATDLVNDPEHLQLT